VQKQTSDLTAPLIFRRKIHVSGHPTDTEGVETLRPLNCWEFMNCSPAKQGDCPAFTADMGHLCWAVIGRKRDRDFGGNTMKRMEHCHACPFYKVRNS